MALKKSELYSSLWQSCDELRGGMDASQYKDYVLVLLFVKYVSDKYGRQPYAPITIPHGASFRDMVALKGKPGIGDDINKKIIGPLASANKLSDFPDFNDTAKLGSGKEMVDRLTNLIAIFENPALDFSKNRADGDDILGDAYEYLMRHFATESGKSKGQFYTPAEVSRIMAQILGIRNARTSAATTVYDPACGSGSLLLKVADEAGTGVTIYGQEKDAATSGLARMNMILHNHPGALIVQGNSLADPKFRSGDTLKTFDYVVANPPFSDKRWSNGLDPLNDPFDRFKPFGAPPAKQGDYAYLLHIVRSMKSTGKGACILPHGVLFRGNAEGDIRRALVRKGYIKGIIGLPANLFYGTGIPACIVVVDKVDAQARKGIFLIDASGGFMKDGPKNRLREMDIHRIVDAFNKRVEIPKYARLVPLAEIEQNDFNLNLPRYIDSQTPEDLQDIEGHLRGGIPAADIDALQSYWGVCPRLRHSLFKKRRRGYLDLSVKKSAIRSAIYDHPEFAAFVAGMNAHFTAWRKKRAAKLKALEPGCHPKEIIKELAESLLAHYAGKPLIDPYDIYQHMMDYWSATMQDDCYQIAGDGWQVKTARIIETDKKGREKDKGWTCDLIPKTIIVTRYFAKDQAAIERLAAELEAVTARLAELEEEHGGEEGVFADLDRVNRANVAARLREIKGDRDARAEAAVLNDWLALNDQETDLKRRHKEAAAVIDGVALAAYPQLTELEIKALVVDDKWLAALDAVVHGEMDRVSRQLTQRVQELGERYETPLPQMAICAAELEAKVSRHLERMGFVGEKRRISQGAMQELLTGKKRLSGFSGKWNVRPLGEIAHITTGTRNNHDKVEDGEYPFFVRSATVESIDSYSYDCEAILVPGEGGIGSIFHYINGRFDVHQRVYVITQFARGTSGRFVYFYMALMFGAYAMQNSVKATVDSLRLPTFQNFEIALPPSADEQIAIAAVLSDMDAEMAALEVKLAKGRQIKQGMMQELLTGKTRLL